MKKTAMNPRLKDALEVTPNDIAPLPMEVVEDPVLKRKADLTPQLISLAHNSHLFVQVESEVVRQPMPGIARAEDGAVPVVWVTDLRSGDKALLICTTVLLGVFERIAPIKDKRLEIVAAEPRPGKNYRDVRVWELA